MRAGRLSVVAGPMFAGKTEALLDRVTAAEAEGLNVEVYKPTTDTRHAGALVVSHANRSHRAKWLEAGTPIPTHFDVVAIDEAQFLPPEAVSPIIAAVAVGVHVILAGLDLTSKGLPFGVLPTFMAYADDVTKLRARCSCGKSACRSYRLALSEETVLVGGAEAYEPRCLSCFQTSG